MAWLQRLCVVLCVWSAAGLRPAVRASWTRLKHRSLSNRPEGFEAAKFGATFFAATRPAPQIGTEVSARQLRALRSSCEHKFPMLLGTQKRSLVRLSDLLGTEYVGPVLVGGQELQVVYDTGSADFWVASDLCTEGPCADPARARYNHSRSTSFRDPIGGRTTLETEYASGRLSGRLGYDDVMVGDLRVRSQALGLIQEELGEAFRRFPLDGIAGLAFSALTFQGGAALIDNLLRYGQSDFAFFLHRDPSKGGAVMWGSSAEASGLFEGELLWLPVVVQRYWALDLVSFRLGDGPDLSGHLHREHWGRERPESAAGAILVVDSGTTFFTAPYGLRAAFEEVVTPRPCSQISQLPDLVYGLRDGSGAVRELRVPPEVYMVRAWPHKHCAPGFVFMDGPPDEKPMLIFGEVYMRHHFTIFRKGFKGEHSAVGFARSRDGPEAEALLQRR